ncbi:hypothetical protein, partial [Nocardioides sp. J9]|uniref:hypothetical protein n=1 Tax=Nocardioides sp. J9 TaxID=935844 RepID=UPI00164524AD
MGLLERARRRAQRGERGAVAVLGSFCLVVLLVVGALAVDAGLHRVLRRDLQAVADVVALDLARELTGKPVSGYSSADIQRINTARDRSVARNATGVGGDLPPGAVTWQLVVRDDDGGWQQASATDVPGGIRVTVAHDVPMAFSGVTGVSRGDARRSAVGIAAKVACLKVSSYAAQVDTGRSWLLDALLGKLLGSGLSARVLDPESGLAGVDLSLLELIEELDALVGADISVASFTKAAGVGVGLSRLMLAAVNVLERQSGRLAEVDLLRNVMGGLQANVSNIDITLSDLVELDTAQEAAAEVKLDLLDLVAGSLAIANGENVIALPLNVKVPLPLGSGGSSLVDLSVRVKVGQRPVVQCGGKAESSQVELELSGNAVNLDLGLVKVQVPLSIRVTLADASATAQSITCLSEGKRVKLLIDSGLLGVDVRLGQRAGDPTSPKLRVALLDIGLSSWKGVEVVSGTIALSSGQSTSRPTRVVDLDIVGDDYSALLPAAVGGLGIPTLHLAFTDLTLLGGLGPLSSLLEFLGIGSLLNWVSKLVLEGLVNPLVSGLDRWLLDPLLRTLGIDLAGG